MSKIERAIIMAAGLGNRLNPITLTTPKPLIKVNGVRMIDTAISALHKNGISEIYVVIGYLKEQFISLEKDYPGVVLLENPYYAECNNIASLYVAREYIENAIIMDGDQIIYNPEILSTDFAYSGYSSVWTDERTDEWLQTVENGVVTSCSRNGGKKGWQLYSVSRWNADDGKKLKRHLEIEFEERKNRQIYWDDVAMFCYPEEYKLGIYPISKEDIVEIEDRIVYTLDDDKDEFTVECINGEFIVEGPAVERLMGRVNIGDNESYHYMEKMLKKLGIEEELRNKGVKEGDTVKLLDWEFEWYE